MKRTLIEQLRHWQTQKYRKPLILKGARQVGKTTILKEFGKKHFPKVHYFNFEKNQQLADAFAQNLDPKHIINDLNFIQQQAIDVTHDLLILDEIQFCPRALTSLKYFCEDMPQLAICTAGSLLGIHLSDNTSFPVGKVNFLSMYPMSFDEFLLASGDQRGYDYLQELMIKGELSNIIHDHFWQRLKHYFIVGGLPEVVQTYVNNQDDLFRAFNKVRAKQEALILAYHSDMAKHAGKVNSMHIERLWRNTPEQLARQQNGSAAKFKVKDTLPGIRGYAQLASVIDWLQKAGLVIKVPIANQAQLPLSAYCKESVFKLYLFDVGLLGTLSGLPPKAILDYDYGSYKGYFAENFVAQEFICAGETELYSWREGTAELEFLRVAGSDIIPVEVKSGWVTRSKSLSHYVKRYSPAFATIMSANTLSINLEKRLYKLPLYLAGKWPLS